MSSFGSTTDFSDVLKFHNLSVSTKQHLSKVYIMLSALVAACAVGSFLSVFYSLGGAGTGLLGFICLIYVAATDLKSSARLPVLLLFGLLEGMSIGPLVNLALTIDPSIITTALFATLGIFACFSFAALYSDTRSALYLGGILSSGLTLLCILSLFTMLFGMRSELLFNVQLYCGLFIFMGYVVYDTQMIIVRVERGEKDYYMHALNLFLDLVQIFVRIIIILIKNSKKNDKD